MIGKTNVGGENVKAEVEYQTPLLTQILESLVGKAQGANATADKILEGYSAYVGQELVHGTAKDASTMVDLLNLTGYTKMAVDKITFSSEIDFYSESVTIPHSLGEKPRVMILVCDKKLLSTSKGYIPFMVGVHSEDYYGTDNQNRGYVVYNRGNSDYSDFYGSNSMEISMFYGDRIEFSLGGIVYIAAGVEYTLITMA